jgi:putative long chain acyl-CoA synthase
MSDAMPPLVPGQLARPISRLGAAAQNAMEVARFGGLATDERSAPYEIAAEHRVYKLRHYFADGGESDGRAAKRREARPPVVLVPPLMLAAEIYDVAPHTSAVTILNEHAVDPWVVDFGAPEREEGGLERTLADHVLAVSDVVDQVREATGRDVHLAGYSQGGMFCYQTAALRRSAGLSSVITFGSPVDTRLGMPFGLPEQLAAELAELLADTFRWSVPAWFSRLGFRMLDPVKSVRNDLEFILHLHDREALLARERQRRFLEGEGWVAWPGPALADFLRQFVAHNRMLEGGFVIEDRLVTLADISCPILSVAGTVDQIAPTGGVRAIAQAAPRAEVYELCLSAGHFGLVVGSAAVADSWPTVAGWVRWRDGEGEQPTEIREPPEDASLELAEQVRSRMGYGLELAAGVGVGIARSLAGTARRATRGALELTRETAGQLPRLARMEQIQPGTRISLGMLVEERRRRAPEGVFFLYEDRAYTAKDFNERIDNVVRGLIEIGVRQGEHVGVLMGPRPSAVALMIAISRLGAVSVLMRPDGDVAREAALGQLERIVADPERAAVAADVKTAETYVLGGGAGPRSLGPLVTDMEQIDPARVTLPGGTGPIRARHGTLRSSSSPARARARG